MKASWRAVPVQGRGPIDRPPQLQGRRGGSVGVVRETVPGVHTLPMAFLRETLELPGQELVCHCVMLEMEAGGRPWTHR